jgi:hypothetical protein
MDTNGIDQQDGSSLSEALVSQLCRSIDIICPVMGYWKPREAVIRSLQDGHILVCLVYYPNLDETELRNKTIQFHFQSIFSLEKVMYFVEKHMEYEVIKLSPPCVYQIDLEVYQIEEGKRTLINSGVIAF